MPELKPLDVDDLKRMLGEKDILVEQLSQAIERLEAELAKKEPEAAEMNEGD